MKEVTLEFDIEETVLPERRRDGVVVGGDESW